MPTVVLSRVFCFAHIEAKPLFFPSVVALSWLQEKKNVATVVKTFNLSQKFVDMSYGIFQQLDLDKNGAIDQK